MKKKEPFVFQAIFSALVLLPATSYSENINSNKPLNCDSTCIVPDSRTTPIPKIQTFVAGTQRLVPIPKPVCGSSAGSVLPSTPTSFLCSIGTPSNVSTTTLDGETSYKWTCSNQSGTQACQAVQRELGVCGFDHGKTLTSNPTNLCSSGQSYGFSLTGNQYTWGCKGNYGTPAQCSATYNPPIPPAMSKTIPVGCVYHNDGSSQLNKTGDIRITLVPINSLVGYLLPAGTGTQYDRRRFSQLENKADGSGSKISNVFLEYPDTSGHLYYGNGAQIFRLSDFNSIELYDYCERDLGGS